jgi:hypothetical protein
LTAVFIRGKLGLSYKGRFRPKSPEKYKGDPTQIIYRSLWELKLMKRFDEHPDIVEWQSEEIAVPYYNPVKGKKSRYFPDFVIKKRIADDKYQVVMIEVKPKKQTSAPDPAMKYKTPTGRVSRRFINEATTYAINEAKWKAAMQYCQERGWVFQVMTETEIRPLGK